MLYDNLRRSYAGNEDAVCNPHPSTTTDTNLFLQVMLAEFALDTTQERGEDDGDGLIVIEDFFDDHPTAKMLTVIDTHTVENGFFAWQRAGGGGVEACRLHEVRVAAVPLALHLHICTDSTGLFSVCDLRQADQQINGRRSS